MDPVAIELVSMAAGSNGRQLVPHQLDGIPTVGYQHGEPFAIRVTNYLGEKIEVIVAVDGTNVLTGQKTSVDDRRRWVIGPKATMELKAWPETNEGGAQFVFLATAGDSVAAHTHGDLFHHGYVTVAVFTEGYQPPVYRERFSYGGDVMRGGGGSRGGFESFSQSKGIDTGLGYTGAGQTVQQAIGTAAGLIMPVLKGTVSVRYLDWNVLQARLRAEGPNPPVHPDVFAQPMANLGSTPRRFTSARPIAPPAPQRLY